MFTFLEPYRYAVIAAVVALLLGASVFYVHRVKVNADKAGYSRAVVEYQAKALAAEQAARAKELELNKKLTEALNEANDRNNKINELSDSFRVSSNSLRDTIAALRNRLSTDTLEAARNKADSALDILGECQKEYGEVAEAADRHASDVKTFEDAWPK